MKPSTAQEITKAMREAADAERRRPALEEQKAAMNARLRGEFRQPLSVSMADAPEDIDQRRKDRGLDGGTRTPLERELTKAEAGQEMNDRLRGALRFRRGEGDDS